MFGVSHDDARSSLYLMITTVSGCMFMFGLVTCLQGLTQNYSGILATRFFLGVSDQANQSIKPALTHELYRRLRKWYVSGMLLSPGDVSKTFCQVMALLIDVKLKVV